MNVLNIEFKAHTDRHEFIRSVLEELAADYTGEDHQVDTYFNVPEGRLKLREGTIERSLIFYKRPNQAGPKPSDVFLAQLKEGQTESIKALLSATLGIKVVVDKIRHIYFVDNIKIHLDNVQQLGTFVEVEAIDKEGKYEVDYLNKQCQNLFEKFELEKASLASRSYSDMLLDGRVQSY